MVSSKTTNGASNSQAIYTQTDNGNALTAVSTGTSSYAIVASSITGGGISAASTSNVGGFFSTNPSSTNTSVEVVTVKRNTSGTAANGLGGFIGYTIQASDGTSQVAGRIHYEWSDATVGTRTSSARIQAVLSTATVDVLTLAGDGSVKLRPITATEASAITPAEGMILMVSSTNGTFVSIGFWGYRNGAWAAF